MINSIKKIFHTKTLREKVIFTLLMLFVCRIGAVVPVPGIDADAAMKFFMRSVGGGQNLFQLMDVFSGGAFSRMTIIALGVMPYISASIIMQLLVAVVPSFQRELKENPQVGRKKISKWTRSATLFLSLFQSWIFAKYALKTNIAYPGIVVSELAQAPYLFYITVMFTMTTGTLFLMWIGEQITERGIGNGISLIITLGILSSLPGVMGSTIKQLNLESQAVGQLTFSSLIVMAILFVFIVIGTILVIQGQRKIPIQYARKSLSHEGSYIPLKINYAGVIPVIFASSFLMFPATIGQWMGPSSFIGRIAGSLVPGSLVYTTVFVLLILFFTFFWTTTQFNPQQIASDMKRNGAFIPGVRQGTPTAEYLERTMGRITLIGGVFLAIIAVLPVIIGRLLGLDARISRFFGGTSLLILVGVILDTAKQIESHLIMKRYQGFMGRQR